jgi:2-dehydro-3-deoxy-L-rhamnonate dehydrogenase (NAD+)
VTGEARTAVVTGGMSGIGAATAARLAQDGVRVLTLDRTDGADLHADVTDAAAVAAAAVQAGPVDILVNAAGIVGPNVPLWEVPVDDWQRVFAVNVGGIFHTCRAFVPGMRERGWGRVVNVSTGYAQLTGDPPAAGAYGWSKTALNVLTRMVAAEAGPRVLVNAADPGWVATRMGGEGAPTPVAEGADTVVWLATLPDDGPTDGFWHRRRRVPW